MKRIRLPRSISLNSVFIYLGLFCVSTFALLEHITISISAFSPVKLYLMYAGFACVLTQLKTISRCILKKKYFYMLVTVLVFCMFLGISMLSNRGSVGGMPLYSTVRFILFLVNTFALMIVLAETGRGKAALKFIFWYMLLIVIINDALMLSRVLTFGTARHENYIVGTKFSVSYLHMDLLTLWLVLYAKKRRGVRKGKLAVLVVTAFIVMIAIRTNCMTGLLGCIMLAFMFGWLQTKGGYRLYRLVSPGVLTVAVVISVLFIIVVDTIVSIPVVRYLVEDVLNRDTSITGRTNIYGILFENMRGHWLQGYGYGNDNEIAMKLFGYANVQNGLMQWVLQIGIPATGSMLAVFAQSFRQLKHSSAEKREFVMPLVILVYLYVILATIETTFNKAFILWFALIFMLVAERREPQMAEQIQGVEST